MELSQEWYSHGSNPVSTLSILLQREGFRTDVCETSLDGHGKETYLLRYWAEEQDDWDGTTYVLMGDLGVTWEPGRAYPTKEIGRVCPEDGPAAAVAVLVAAAA